MYVIYITIRKNIFSLLLSANPNQSEEKHVLFIPRQDDHKGSALHFFAEKVKIYFERY